MGRKAVDIRGKVFGPFTAMRCVGTSPCGQKLWLARCRCGEETVKQMTDLRRAIRQAGCVVCSPVKRGGSGHNRRTWQINPDRSVTLRSESLANGDDIGRLMRQFLFAMRPAG